MKSIDDKVKDIMALKEKIGEFSLDLYYNDIDNNNPFTAKLHTVLDTHYSFHARAKSFDKAIDIVQNELDKLISEGFNFWKFRTQEGGAK